jgi:hypothetical protein
VSLIASEFTVFDCTSNAEDDVSTVGGAIDLTSALIDQNPEPSGSADGSAKSTIGGDTTQTATLRYRGASGKIYSASGLLNGLVAVDLTSGQAEPFPERMLSVSVSAAVSGNISFAAPFNTNIFATLALPYVGATVPTRGRRMFNQTYSVPGSTTTFYDKLFWRNNNNTGFTALSPTYRITADPQALILQGIHTSKNDSATIANRLTAPAGITFVDDNVDQVGSDLANNADYQGVWIQMVVPAAQAAVKSTFTTQITVGTI